MSMTLSEEKQRLTMPKDVGSGNHARPMYD